MARIHRRTVQKRSSGARSTTRQFLATRGRDNRDDGLGRKAPDGVRGRLNLAILSRLACLFLKRGADLGVRDSEGRDPLTIAVETANADIVTL